MPIGDVKNIFKSFVKFWWLSPEAIMETYQEKQESFEKDATNSLSIHRYYYKK